MRLLIVVLCALLVNVVVARQVANHQQYALASPDYAAAAKYVRRPRNNPRIEYDTSADSNGLVPYNPSSQRKSKKQFFPLAMAAARVAAPYVVRAAAPLVRTAVQRAAPSSLVRLLPLFARSFSVPRRMCLVWQRQQFDLWLAESLLPSLELPKSSALSTESHLASPKCPIQSMASQEQSETPTLESVALLTVRWPQRHAWKHCQIRSIWLGDGWKFAGTISKYTGGFKGFARGQATGRAGTFGKVLQTVNKVSGAVQRGAGKVTQVAGKVQRGANKVASISDRVSRVSQTVNNVAGRFANNQGTTGKIARGVQRLQETWKPCRRCPWVSRSVGRAAGDVNKATNRYWAGSQQSTVEEAPRVDPRARKVKARVEVERRRAPANPSVLLEAALQVDVELSGRAPRVLPVAPKRLDQRAWVEMEPRPPEPLLEQHKEPFLNWPGNSNQEQPQHGKQEHQEPSSNWPSYSDQEQPQQGKQGHQEPSLNWPSCSDQEQPQHGKQEHQQPKRNRRKL
ncbi:hypothetical protein Ae201684P_003127 [Aphanomyces euteiches]|nr:hypothetical protein Ae201684P_003127 [Aphanomyces euteiches]